MDLKAAGGGCEPPTDVCPLACCPISREFNFEVHAVGLPGFSLRQQCGKRRLSQLDRPRPLGRSDRPFIHASAWRGILDLAPSVDRRCWN